jgi:hypothetical protein
VRSACFVTPRSWGRGAGTLAPGNGKANFDAFFRRLGSQYERLLDDGVDVYKMFRCGMAHEYLIKGDATVAMLKGVEPAGVAVDSGHYYFVVERYFEHFQEAAVSLETELLSRDDPQLPAELT